jgi:hypothetical protein
MNDRAKERPQTPWTAPIRVEDVPDGGRQIELHPDEATRSALAAYAGLRAVLEASAAFEVRRHGRDGLRVTGDVRAVVGQTCVVSLEPMDSAVHESIDVVFKPAAEASAAGANEGAGDGAEQDPPETLIDGSVDLGALATEFLILGLDPYPRKEGALFEAPATAASDAGPFAALARLKGAPGGEK